MKETRVGCVELTAVNESSLPVTAVTLFSSGVAYTQREGSVDAGEASVGLTFRTSQINDILKSLVLLDSDGVALPAVYPSQDPIERTLQSFAVNVSAFRTRAELLQQMRGAPIRIETQNAETFEGQIVAIESELQMRGTDHTIETAVLTLLTQTGMISVALDKIRLLKLLDERRDKELREALSILASGSDDARRTVQLRFSGKKKRGVKVGYITEAPLWKISYRLVLEDDQKPYLQGWALVENTTDEDWKDVHLTLVSGRPVSFIQDLYKPLYVPRPIIPLDMPNAPLPQLHQDNMNSLVFDLSGDDEAYTGGAAALSAPAPAMTKSRARAVSVSSMSRSVVSQAEGKSVGELFQYDIAASVALPRQQAAMIPVVAGSIGGAKISIYNADTDPIHPLNAVRLENTTSLHLKAGPITVFDGGSYAGDARMEEVPPTDSRLITYAVDLAIEGERQSGKQTRTEASLSIKNGALLVTHKHRNETVYKLKSKVARERTVLVEHPFQPEWTLKSPKEPTERTRDRYRFAVAVLPGETASLSVLLERTALTTIALVDGDLGSLQSYTTTGEISPKVKEAVTVAMARRRRVSDLEAQADALDKERTQIHQEQERIRANLGALDKDADLYRRYLAELSTQENRLLELREESNRLRASARTAYDELRRYLEMLEI
jgi:hypothetical protein